MRPPVSDRQLMAQVMIRTRARWLAGGLLLACAGFATACSKHSESPPPAARSAPTSPQGASQPTPPATPVTTSAPSYAKATADALMNDAHLPVYKAIAQARGFTLDSPITCTADPLSFHADYMCATAIEDTQRGDRAAVLRFFIFGADIDVPGAIASLKDRGSTEPGQRSLVSDAGISVNITNSSGATSPGGTMPGRCHQSLGEKNQPPVCVFFPTARVIMITQVNPAKASFDAGDDPNVDVQHSKDLAMVGLFMLALSNASAAPDAPASNSSEAFQALDKNKTLVDGVMSRAHGSQATPCQADPACAGILQHLGKAPSPN